MPAAPGPVSISFAIPKSRIFTRPSAVTNRFPASGRGGRCPSRARPRVRLRSGPRSRRPCDRHAAAASASRSVSPSSSSRDHVGRAVMRAQGRGPRGCSDGSAPRRPRFLLEAAQPIGIGRDAAGSTLIATSRPRRGHARGRPRPSPGAKQRHDLIGAEGPLPLGSVTRRILGGQSGSRLDRSASAVEHRRPSRPPQSPSSPGEPTLHTGFRSDAARDRGPCGLVHRVADGASLDRVHCRTKCSCQAHFPVDTFSMGAARPWLLLRQCAAPRSHGGRVTHDRSRDETPSSDRSRRDRGCASRRCGRNTWRYDAA